MSLLFSPESKPPQEFICSVEAPLWKVCALYKAASVKVCSQEKKSILSTYKHMYIVTDNLSTHPHVHHHQPNRPITSQVHHHQLYQPITGLLRELRNTRHVAFEN